MWKICVKDARRLILPISGEIIYGPSCKRWASAFPVVPVQQRIIEANATRSPCPDSGDLKRQRSKWSTAEDDMLVRFRQEGRMLKEVAVYCNRTYSAVYRRTRRVLRQRGLEHLLTKIRPDPWRAEEDATLLKLRREGMSFPAINQRLARTPSSLHSRYMRLTKTTSNPSEFWTAVEDVKLVAKLKSGQPWPTIYAAFPSRSVLAVQTRCTLIRPYLDSGQDFPPKRRRHPWTPALNQELLHLRDDLKLSWLEVQKRMRNWGVRSLWQHYYIICLQRSTPAEQPSPNSSAWEEDEDSRISQARATSTSKKWLIYACKLLPHRTRDAIKNRWRKQLRYTRDLAGSGEDSETSA